MICTVAAIVITLHAKSAVIECEEGRRIKTSVIVGKPQTPTPTGEFYPQVIDSTGQVGFLQHEDDSWFAIHANSKSLPQSGSLGCVRLDPKLFWQLKWSNSSQIRIFGRKP